MKKILLFMLPVMAMSLASCEKNNGELSGDDVIEFKDPNFLKALLVVQEIEIYDVATGQSIPYLMDVDANKDGAITVNEARKVKGLQLYTTDVSFNISEMPEIKYFTALEFLDCCDNQLMSLDVSKNTALIILYCMNNHLAYLDLSNNTALIDLSCDDNQLTSLDVSGCADLKGITCSENQLTSLDLSNNTALIDLLCDNNRLTSLDVHYNRELEQLGCSDNPLEKLIIYAHHNIHDWWIEDIESEYGDIIEYME